MRPLLLAATLFGMCATTPRQPCEYDVHVRLTEDADGECHQFNLVDHNGNRMNNTSEVYGCAPGGIISNGTRSNVGHENGHLIEKFCPEWAAGYFR